MYYNNIKEKYVVDSLLLCDKDHNKKKKYKNDKIDYKGYTYKSNDEFEKDLYIIKEETAYIPENPNILEYKIQYISEPHTESKVYEEEKQQVKSYGDLEFYEWLNKQTDPKLAIFAEIINAPKLHHNIEMMRDNVKSVSTISINEYKKIKKLGSRSVKMIKELKEKYGVNILKFLYLSISQ